MFSLLAVAFLPTETFKINVMTVACLTNIIIVIRFVIYKSVVGCWFNYVLLCVCESRCIVG